MNEMIKSILFFIGWSGVGLTIIITVVGIRRDIKYWIND